MLDRRAVYKEPALNRSGRIRTVIRLLIVVLLLMALPQAAPNTFAASHLTKQEPVHKTTVPKPAVKAITSVPPPVAPVAAPVEPVAPPVAAPTPAPKAVVPVAPSANAAMDFIFQHESGGNPLAVNSIGCVGLGQACPASKLTSICPNLGDVACQVQFFTDYAISRYGSWQNAQAFWVANGWW